MKTHLSVVAAVFLSQAAGSGQPTPPLTISQTVERAVAQYPAVRAASERALSAAEAINLARTAYLPRADFLAQINRATRNNVFGLMLPQPVIPSISGPVLGTNGLSSAWGSATGVLVSWEPFDFGLRRANVETAESTRKRADADTEFTRFQVQTAAADAFLTLLAAEQSVAAAEAGAQRGRVLVEVVESLARAGLRPGAEAARARAEVAASQTQVARARQAVDVSRAALAALIGSSPGQVAVQSGPLLELPAETPAAPASTTSHPLARRQEAAVEEVKAVERALDRAFFPRFNLQGTTYARGTGARTDGSVGGTFSGFGPNTQNWALGMTVQFQVSEFASLRARKQVELHRERSEAAQYERVLRDLEGQARAARAQLEGARQVAANTRTQLEAARAADEQSGARYKAGLSSIVEVADAERLLTQAEADNALAKLAVWRALLSVSAARGELEPFLQLAGQ